MGTQRTQRTQRTLRTQRRTPNAPSASAPRLLLQEIRGRQHPTAAQSRGRVDVPGRIS
ncbi:hypothetical protein [Cryobacterium psychrophilum]|uniref:hypothetical protein n=1 Tax=Cryobacterium psychrophilum TaxID=41988 RepID=UPI0014170107|nr:hypothetical protein [Cryobacterium psychrophilum]